MRKTGFAVIALMAALLAGCAPSPEQQAAMAAAQRAQDQGRCSGFGFQPGTDAFAHCMMTISTQRDADAAADQRAKAAQAAADQRAKVAQQQADDAAARDAWDRKTGQGIYASPSYTPYSPPSTPSNQVDAIQKSIQDDIDRINKAGMLTE